MIDWEREKNGDDGSFHRIHNQLPLSSYVTKGTFFIINEPTFVVVLLTKRRRVKGKESECVSRSVVSCDPMDCNPPGSSVHGILQMRILEWGAIPFSRDRTGVSCIGRQVLYCLDHQGTLKVILHSDFLSCYLMSFFCFRILSRGRGFGREWIHAYVWLSPFAVPLKPSQHC